jgi:hypothetical protein
VSPTIHGIGHVVTWGPDGDGMHPQRLELGFSPGSLPNWGTHMESGLSQCYFCHSTESFDPYYPEAIRFCENCHTVDLLHTIAEHTSTNNIYTIDGVPNQEVTADEKCFGCHVPISDPIDFRVGQEIVYGGALDKSQDGVLVDTLITVTHSNNNVAVPVKILVYDKAGTKVAEAALFNGGEALEDNRIPIRGFGWITLGMIVTPGGSGAERFSFKVVIGRADYIPKPTFVEVTQVVYNSRQQHPGEAIWDPANITSWSQTSLGGKRGTGLVRSPSEWDE